MDNINCINSIRDSIIIFLDKEFDCQSNIIVDELVEIIQIDVDDLYKETNDDAYDEGYEDGYKCGKQVTCIDQYQEGYHDGIEDEKLRLERIEQLESDLQGQINIRNGE